VRPGWLSSRLFDVVFRTPTARFEGPLSSRSSFASTGYLAIWPPTVYSRFGL
jgi:hypothetical protein